MRYRLPLFVLVGALALLAAGCIDDAQDQHASTTQPSDAVLADPGNYHPKISDEEMDISGGDTGHLDKKALKRDWDNVFNP